MKYKDSANVLAEKEYYNFGFNQYEPFTVRAILQFVKSNNSWSQSCCQGDIGRLRMISCWLK